MLRKKFFAVILFVATIFATASAHDPYADKNLVLFYQHQGYEYFLKRDTLAPEDDGSLQTISFYYMVFDSITPKNTRWDKEDEMAFAYDAAERKVYFVGREGELLFLNPKGTVAEGSGYAAGAEIAYYLVFGEKFYGTFDEDFYQSLN